MFPRGDNAGFSEWLATAKLAVAHDHDRAAAMWGADNKHFLGDLMSKYPRVRTLRGLHAKWKKPNPEPQQEKRSATHDDLRKVQRLRALRDEPSATDGERAYWELM